MNDITVIKYDHSGAEKMRYPGTLLSRQGAKLVLQAEFTAEYFHFDRISFYKGDLFIETYYSDRWYNIYEIHDHKDDTLKGWYCNVSYPAEFTNGLVTFRDLALDLLVYPDGRQIVLDHDEFDALSLDESVRRQALNALAELENMNFTPRS